VQYIFTYVGAEFARMFCIASSQRALVLNVIEFTWTTTLSGPLRSMMMRMKGTLVISGMYGRFKNTGLARDNMMEGAAGGDGAKVAVKPKDFKPAGSDVTVTCEVLVQTQLGTEITIPVCGWVDGNTGASIAEITADTVTKKPAQVDLAAAAEAAVKIRDEIRKPIG
jgi:hypothetical protein